MKSPEKDASLADSMKAGLIKTCTDNALKLLVKARQSEPARFAASKTDPDLTSLRAMKEFQSLYQSSK